MSMQRVANYGSFLQAYGLMTTIKELGFNNVKFVDYEFGEDIVPEKKNKRLAKFLNNPSLIDRKKRNEARTRFRKAYSAFLKDLGITEEFDYDKDLDTLVIGSDEVFNCMQHYPVGYSKGLFGKGYEKSNVLSYAASFGHTTLQNLKEKSIDTEIGEMLSRFRAISVRDENSKKIVEELTDKQPEIFLDPVLISNYPEVNAKMPCKDYIIVYAYQNRLSRAEEKAIRKLAKKYNKKVVSLGFYQRCADYNLIVEPLEVLSIFKGADYVVTDTFHGSIFSIKTNRKFCTLVRSSNKNKLVSLLKKMHCEEQIANNISDIERIYENGIDFTACNKVIEEETKKSRKFLQENL